MTERVKHKLNSSQASCPLPTGSSPTELPTTVTELLAVIAKTAASSFDRVTHFPTSSVRFSLFTLAHVRSPDEDEGILIHREHRFKRPLTCINRESTNINARASDNRVCHFVSAQFSGS